MRPKNKLEMFEPKCRIGTMGRNDVSKGQCGKHGRSSLFMCCLLCVVEQNENVKEPGRTQHCIFLGCQLEASLSCRRLALCTGSSQHGRFLSFVPAEHVSLTVVCFPFLALLSVFENSCGYIGPIWII